MTSKNSLTIIAEVGSVHDGSIGNALRLIDAATECGAHVVKFQTHIPEAESLVDAPSPAYFNDEPRFEYFERTSFSLNEWRRISRHCKDVGVGFCPPPSHWRR
jgi:N-acetylneuraminate synthase